MAQGWHRDGAGMAQGWRRDGAGVAQGWRRDGAGMAQGWRRDGAGMAQGWRRDGAVVRALASHQYAPGSIPGPGVICGLSLLLVLFLAPRGFSPGTPQKPTFPNSNSIWNCQALYQEPLAQVSAQALPVFDIKFAFTFTFTFTFTKS